MENSAIFALMKSYSLIGILLLWLLASCKQAPTTIIGGQMLVSASDTALSLAGVDSVMQQWPDSALTLLLDCRDGVHTVSTEPTDRHYYELLLAEALYKNDSAQANRKELQQAMAYYDSLCSCKDVARNASTIAFLDARAHYMNGVGYYENDNTVEACKEYMKALDVMKSHFEEKELMGYKAKIMALTYTRLAMLFSDLYLHEQAIYFARISLPYYHYQNSPTWQISRMLYEIGCNYDIIDQLDSADYYYQYALIVLNDTNSLAYKDIVTLRSIMSYKMGNQQDSILSQLYHLLNQSISETEYLSRCLTIGEVYYHEKQFDSAWYYLNNVYTQTNSIASKKQAAEWLQRICEINGWDSKIYEYIHFLAPFANQEENTSATKSQLTELYNTFRQNNLERQHRHIIRKGMTWTIAVLGGLLILMLIITLLYHQNKKKLIHFQNNNLEENKTPSKALDLYTAFLEEPVCQEILLSIQGENIKRSATPKDYSNLILSDGQLQQLAITVNHYFGPFENQLEQHGIKVNNTMVSLCHLYLLGIDEKQAAILLNRDYSSISRYGKKLKTTFNTQENLTVFFRNFVINW